MRIEKEVRYIGVVFVIRATGKKQANVLVELHRYKDLATGNVKNVNCVDLRPNN